MRGGTRPATLPSRNLSAEPGQLQFDPDPELVDHLEGNASERERYRAEIEALRQTSQTEPSK
jgi:hypothetical protein